MSQIGALSVKIGADTKDLTKGLSSAKGEIGGLDKSIKDMLPSIKQIAVVGAAAATALAVMVKRAIDTADEMGKAAQKVGVTTEELSKLEYAAKLANVSSGELQSSLMRLTKGMSDAAQGTGEAQKGFAALGIQIKNSDGSLKSSTQVMEEVADRFAVMKDGAEKTALSIAIFNRSGAGLIPLLNGGSKAIREAGDELERMGGVVTADAARNAQIFNDNLTRLSRTVTSIAMAIAKDILPVLIEFSNRVMVAINANLGFFRSLRLLATGASSYQEQIGKLEKQIEDLDKTANSSWLGARGLQRGDRDSALRERINAEIKALKELQAMQEELSKPFQPPSENAPSLATNEEQKKLHEQRLEMLRQLAEQEAINEQRRRDDIFATLEARRLSYATENDLELERYARELQNLMDAKQAQFLTEEQYRLATEEAAKRYEENLTNIAKREADKRANIERQTQAAITSARASAVQQGIGFLNAFAGKSKAAAVAAVALNKALAIAQIIQNTAVAQMRALAELGPIAGPPAAAKIGMYGKIQAGIAAATGLMQVAGAAAGGGGANISPVGVTSGGVQTGTQSDGTSFGGTQTRMTPQTVTIQLQGEVFGREQIRELISQINEAVSDGSVLRLQ